MCNFSGGCCRTHAFPSFLQFRYKPTTVDGQMLHLSSTTSANTMRFMSTEMCRWCSTVAQGSVTCWEGTMPASFVPPCLTGAETEMNATHLSPSVLSTTRLSSLLSLRLDEVSWVNHGISNGTREKYNSSFYLCFSRVLLHAAQYMPASSRRFRDCAPHDDQYDMIHKFTARPLAIWKKPGRNSWKMDAGPGLCR